MAASITKLTPTSLSALLCARICHDSDGIDKERARILLNLIMLAVQAAPRGGTVTISRHGRDDGAEFVLVSEGPKVRLDPAVAKAIAGKAPEDGFDGYRIIIFQI